LSLIASAFWLLRHLYHSAVQRYGKRAAVSASVALVGSAFAAAYYFQPAPKSLYEQSLERQERAARDQKALDEALKKYVKKPAQ
jgi:hypothetical protein